MKTKWEFIATKLEEFNAPKEIVDNAKTINQILIGTDLGWNTDSWKEFDQGSVSDVYDLLDVVQQESYCTACEVHMEHCHTFSSSCPLWQPSEDYKCGFGYEDIVDWLEKELIR